MPFLVIVMSIIIGVCLYAGIHFGMHYRHTRRLGAGESTYGLFSFLCFATIGYCSCELAAFASQDASAYVTAFKWRGVFAELFKVCWPWFVYRYTRVGPRRLVLGLSLISCVMLIPNLVRPYGAFFDAQPILETHTLPWGETMYFHAASRMNVWGAALWMVLFVLLGHTLYASYRQYQRGERRMARMLASTTVILVTLSLSNLVSRAGWLDVPFLAQFGIPLLIAIMSVALHWEARVKQERVQGVLDYLPAVVSIKDGEGRYLSVNRAFELFFDAKSSEVIGRTEAELGDLGNRLKAGLDALVDGSDERYHTSNFQVATRAGELDAYCTVATDIGAQVELTRKYRALFDSARDAIYIMKKGRFVDCNEAALRFFRCERDELVGASLLDVSPPQQYDGTSSEEMAEERAAEALRGVPQRFSWQHCRADGSLFDTEVTLNRIEIGGVLALQGIVRDVSEQRWQAEAIRQVAAGVSAETGTPFFRHLAIHLASVFGADYSMVAVLDPSNPRRVNTLAICAHGEVVENTSYELVGTPCEDVLTKEACAYAQGVQELFPADELLVELGVDSYVGTPLRDSRGEVMGLLSVMHRTSLEHFSKVGELLQIFAARAGAELERLRSENEVRKLSQAVEQSPNSMVITDPDGVVEYVNPAFSAVSGYAASEVVGKTQRLLASGKTPPEVYKELWQTILAGRTWRGELINRRKDGSHYTEAQTIAPVLGEDGEVKHFVAIKQDVTELRKTEAALRQSQKLDAVGQLAGGVAHDFNNQLTAVLGGLDVLRACTTDDDEMLELVNFATKATLRCTDLTEQLLSFSRTHTTEKVPVNLSEELTKLETLVVRAATPAIEVRFELEEKLWLCMTEPGSFQDAILNLAINARDAMPDGGQLTITTENLVASEDDVRMSPGLSTGEFVRVTVRDTGIGMDETTRERLFEPFFTTKPEGKGTGLGLAMVYAYVERSEGGIAVESEPGKGATFALYLPRSIDGAPRPSAQQTEPDEELPRGSETVLVVDDEEPLRWLASEYLRSLGYDVVMARDPKEALAKLAEGISVQLLFSDVVMPGGTNGFELAKEATAQYPELRVLMTSGFMGESVDAVDMASFPFLKKPYRKSDLARKVREILG